MPADGAARVGASRVRVIAGQSETDGAGTAVRRSITSLLALVEYAGTRGVEILTENWCAVTRDPANLLAILDSTRDAVGLCADFGNYGGPTNYEDLESILPYAWSDCSGCRRQTAVVLDNIADFDQGRTHSSGRARQDHGAPICVLAPSAAVVSVSARSVERYKLDKGAMLRRQGIALYSVCSTDRQALAR